MKWFITLYLSFFCFSKSFGETQKKFTKDSLLGIKYYTIADSSYLDIPRCKRYSKLAIPLLKKTKQWKKYITCFGFLSYCYEYEEAYDSLVINNKFAFEETKKYIPTTSSQYIYSLSNLGFMYSRVIQDYQRATELFEEAVQVAFSKDIQFGKEDEDSNLKGVLFKNLGDIFLIKGDYQAAIEHFKKASDYYEKIVLLYDGANIRLAESYKSIAKAYQGYGNKREAATYLQKLLLFMASKTVIFPQKHYAYAYFQLAELSIDDAADIEALKWLKKAQSLPDLTPTQIAELNRLYALYFIEKKDYKTALTHINIALKNQIERIPVKAAQRYILKGEILSKQKKHKEALQIFNKATTLLLPQSNGKIDLTHFDRNQKILSHLDLISVLAESAKAYKGLSEAENDLQYHQKAIDCYRIISELSDDVRGEYLSSESKLFLSKNIHQFYENAIESAFLLFQKSGEKNDIEQAFFFIEKSKAAVLLEELNAKEAAGQSAIPKEIIEEKFRLRTDLNICQKKLEEQSSKDKPKEKLIQILNNRLFELTQKQAALKEKIRKEYPKYAELTRGKIPNLSSIQESLNAKEAIIEYFIGSEKGYAFFITKNNLNLKEIPIEEIKKDADALVKNLKIGKKKNDFCLPAHRLHANTLGIFDLQDVAELLIIPDGTLSQIPFEVLLPKIPKEDNPKFFDYLIHSKAINYAFSLSLYQLQAAKKKSGGEVLIIAPIFESNSSKLLKLNEADTTVFSSFKKTVLLKEQASLSGFLNNIENFGMIYFSTHASAMNPEEQPSIEFIDSLLYLSDLYTFDLPTDLVVLSACETGIGGEQKGEGVMSLARGFSYAGVPSTVATLWKVNQKATGTIVRDFHSFLTKGYSKSKALQKAKINYLKNCPDIKSTPFYWSSLVVIGNNQPFEFEKENSRISILVFGLLSIFLLFFGYKRLNNLDE